MTEPPTPDDAPQTVPSVFDAPTVVDESSPIEHGRADRVGEYVIESVVGRGAMGVVYAAVHSVIERRVAIKVLRRELSERPDAALRFVKEARAVNRIRHPGVVDVFGYGTTDDGSCFLVMELLEGTSLGQVLDRGRVPFDRACEILIEVTHALEAAHEHGVVHRDLKPDNVFLVGGTQVKLLDFGIAKLLGPSGRAPSEHTQPGVTIGTPSYMAPEQARAEEVDGRADIYALGAMAFELFTGRPPFNAPSSFELISQHVTKSPPRPTDCAPGLPILTDALLLAMLEKAPARRPSLPEVRHLLAQLREAAAAPVPPAQPDVPERGRWWKPIGIAACALAGCALAYTLATRDAALDAALEPDPHALEAPITMRPAPPDPARVAVEKPSRRPPSVAHRAAPARTAAPANPTTAPAPGKTATPPAPVPVKAAAPAPGKIAALAPAPGKTVASAPAPGKTAPPPTPPKRLVAKRPRPPAPKKLVPPPPLPRLPAPQLDDPDALKKPTFTPPS